MFYIIDKDKNVVAKCDGQPNIDDLTSREETIIESATNIPLHKAKVNGVNIEEDMTAVALTDEQKDLKLINQRIFDNAQTELKTEGKLISVKYK